MFKNVRLSCFGAAVLALTAFDLAEAADCRHVGGLAHGSRQHLVAAGAQRQLNSRLAAAARSGYRRVGRPSRARCTRNSGRYRCTVHARVCR